MENSISAVEPLETTVAATTTTAVVRAVRAVGARATVVVDDITTSQRLKDSYCCCPDTCPSTTSAMPQKPLWSCWCGLSSWDCIWVKIWHNVDPTQPQTPAQPQTQPQTAASGPAQPHANVSAHEFDFTQRLAPWTTENNIGLNPLQPPIPVTVKTPPPVKSPPQEFRTGIIENF